MQGTPDYEAFQVVPCWRIGTECGRLNPELGDYDRQVTRAIPEKSDDTTGRGATLSQQSRDHAGFEFDVLRATGTRLSLPAGGESCRSKQRAIGRDLRKGLKNR